jgi:menaquinone-dependent protoporphyrinogen oxidase
MARHILIAYATKHGSTREVAAAIANTVAATGDEVDLRNAAQVHELDAYDGIVLGGSLYMGRWHPDAVGFIEDHRTALTTIPIAVFAMGPKTLAASEVASAHVQLGRALAKFPDVKPAKLAIFGGVIDPHKLRFPLSHLPASDARDWEAIAAWARDVTTAFEATRPILRH